MLFFKTKKPNIEDSRNESQDNVDLQIINKMNQEFAISLDLKETLNTALKIIITRLNAQAANIFLINNKTKKFECIFTSVEIQENNSVMFKNLSGSKLGIWSAHGEGKFNLPYSENKYNIVGKYGYNSYPANPNGSDYNTAIISNKDGRHIAMMPHLERSTFPWNWGYYPKS